jgi:hypothetical protein
MRRDRFKTSTAGPGVVAERLGRHDDLTTGAFLISW